MIITVFVAIIELVVSAYKAIIGKTVEGIYFLLLGWLLLWLYFKSKD